MTELLSIGSLNEVRQFVQEVYLAEIALLIESLEPEDRKVIWKLIPLNTVAGGVLLTTVSDVEQLQG